MPNPVGALTKIKKMHSPLEKAVAAHKLESMPSAQWSAYIKANAPKSAKKEALAVKLDELLARQPKVTKAEIVQHIKDNSPKIKTKLLKDKPYTAGDIDSHVNIEPNGSGGYRYIDDNGDVVHESWGTDAMVDYLNSTEGAKYGEHVLPGGQNYQEMLLSLPRNQSQAIIRNQKVYEIKDANGQLLATGQLPMSPRTQAKLNNNPDWVVREFEQPNPNDLRRDPANFQSGHYDESNLLAHMRMNDRPTAEGKRALFLEELQSDWAQQGRREGFLTPDLHIERRAEIKAEMDALANEAAAMRERGESPDDIHQRMRQLDAALRDIPTPKGIPRAPYVEDTGDWTGLGLKKAIEHAVEQGHDSIAWTTGAQQADRYNLSKQIDSIHHNVNPDGTYSFSAVKDGREVISKENLTPDELADHLGKDVAGKIVKGEGGSSPSGTSVGWQPESSIYGEIDDVAPEYKTLSGLDLEVGGEGMRGYYDQIVPQTANDILKSMGVTERVKPIGVQLHPNQIASQYESMGLTGRNPGDIIKPANISEQMGFQITPEIRDYVLNQGLPAFAGGGIVKAVGKGLRGMAEKYRLAHEAAQKNAVELLGLPPGNTAMDRAKAMGYDTKVYRGTGSDERVARKSSGHEHGIEGISTTLDPRYASMHGNNVMPLLAKSGNVEDYFDLINNFENKTGRSFSDASERLFTDAVKGEGVRASALHDPNAGLDIRYLYPEDLRSVNAAFDPAHAKSPDLLKARGGSVNMAGGGVVKAGAKGLRNLVERYRLAHETAQKNAVELLGLPPDNTAMDRAKALGYTTPAYHGTKNPNIKSLNELFYSAENPTLAGEYAKTKTGKFTKGSNTLPLLINLGKNKKLNTAGEYEYQFMKSQDGIDLGEDPYYWNNEGYDSATHSVPEYQKDSTYLNFNPQDVRSRFAAFDPFRRDEADILAGVGVGLPVSGLIDKQEPIKKAEGGEVDYDEIYEFRDYGTRETGEPKDTGALGEIRMPNGRDVMTEYAINVDGREMPSIVEGMHPADVNYIRETGSVPQDAVATAVRSANKREASGQSPFWNRKDQPAFAHGGEVDYDSMYEFR